MKKCWYFEAGKSIEENRTNAKAKIKKRAEKKKRGTEKIDAEKAEKEKKEETLTIHKGTIVQIPHPRTEQTSMALVTELSSELYCEPCNLMGMAYDEIDFIYDTGTGSGVLGPKERSILANVENEDVLIETVTGQKSMSKEFGDTMFGKTRILKDRHGSVLVSQYSSRKMYNIFNPDKIHLF